METRTYQAAVSEATHGNPTLTDERRKTYRKSAQLPVRVRDYYGEMEITQTENLSYEGFCFWSCRNYHVGQGVVVICPFDAEEERAEVRARIIRAEPGSGRDRRIYGVRYEHALH